MTVFLFRCLGRLPGIRGSEVAGHGCDLVLGPQGAAPDHAVEDAFPAAAVLAMVLPHRRGVALKAFADEHFFSRRIGEPGRLCALRVRRRREEQAAEKNRKDVFAEHWHRLPLFAGNDKRASRECQSRLVAPRGPGLSDAASGTSWIPTQRARGAPGA